MHCHCDNYVPTSPQDGCDTLTTVSTSSLPTNSYKFASEVKPAFMWVHSLNQYLFVVWLCSLWTLNLLVIGLGQWFMLTDEICASDIRLLDVWDLAILLLCIQGKGRSSRCLCLCIPNFLFANHTHIHTQGQTQFISPAIYNFRVIWHGVFSCS